MEALDFIPLLSGRAGMSSAASLLQEPRALFAITPTGSCSAGKMSLLPFPPMLQFLSSVSGEQFYSPRLQVTAIRT